jgi:periplasmic divalent cation tolerance protein
LAHDDKPVLVYATFPTLEAAEAAAAAIVERGLAACANILPGMVSVYVWEGKLQREQEAAMVLKTMAGCAEALVEEVRRLHSYDNPAVLVLPVTGGSHPFLDWIASATSGGG